MLSFPEWLPPFHVVELITPDEAKKVIEMAEKFCDFKPARVQYPTGEIGVVAEHCTCSMATFGPGHLIYSAFANSVLAQTEALNRRYEFDLYEDFTRRFPNISILRYEAAEGGHFRPHIDLGGHRGVDHRKLTMVIPLNRDYVGGRLHVDVGEVYDTQQHADVGYGIVFPSFAMHHVTPVTKGVRYVAVAWLHGPHFR